MGKSLEAFRGHDYRDLGCQVILFQRNDGFLKIFSKRGRGKGGGGRRRGGQKGRDKGESGEEEGDLRI